MSGISDKIDGVLGLCFPQFAARRMRRTLRTLKSVGEGVECDPTVFWRFPERISVGNFVYVGPRTELIGRGGLHIHDHVIIGPECVILTSLHHYHQASLLPYDDLELLRPVSVERCVWIGQRAFILPGVTLGEGSIVGAGAIVTKSCPPGSILGGNPAKIIGSRDMEQYRALVADSRFYLQQKQKLGFEKREILDSRITDF
jgi:acetyltransferase-like isoleucine patch superfamily enzyme